MRSRKHRLTEKWGEKPPFDAFTKPGHGREPVLPLALLLYMNAQFPPSSLPAPRWFRGWDQKDVCPTVSCCFNGRGGAAKLVWLLYRRVIKSDLGYVCLCVGSHFGSMKNSFHKRHVDFCFFIGKSSNYSCTFGTTCWPLSFFFFFSQKACRTEGLAESVCTCADPSGPLHV